MMTTTTASPFDLDGYNDSVSGRTLLGQIVFFSVADTHVDHGMLTRALDYAGLGDYAPNCPAPADVFRKVTSGAETTIDHGDGTRSKVMVRDVDTDHQDLVQRRVVVETLDRAGRRLDYRQVWDLTFDKESGNIAMAPITIVQGEVVARDLTCEPSLTDDIVPDLRVTYANRLNKINADGIRVLIKRVILGNLGVPLRPTGGVFFLPDGNADKLTALRQALSIVDGTRLFGASITDEDGVPDEVRFAVTDATIADADRLIDKFAKAVESGTPISKRALDTMVEQHAQLRTRLATYKGLLHDELSQADMQLLVLDDHFAQMFLGSAA